MEPRRLGKPSDPGRSGSDRRRFVGAVPRVAWTGGSWRDLPPLIDGVDFGGPIADEAYDDNAIIAALSGSGAKTIISRQPRRAAPRKIECRDLQMAPLDRECLRQAEQAFKRIAMRADKTDQSFAAIICLAAAVIHSR